jgi:hypothetical protein
MGMITTATITSKINFNNNAIRLLEMVSSEAESFNCFPLKSVEHFWLNTLLQVARSRVCEVGIHHWSRAVIYRNSFAQLEGLSRPPLESQLPTPMFPEP